MHRKDIYVPDLQIKKPEIGDLPVRLASYIGDVARQQFAELMPDFPFLNLYAGHSYIGKDYVATTVYELYHRSGTIMTDIQQDPDLLSKYSQIFENNPYPTFEEIDAVIGDAGFSFDTFSYVGKFSGGKISSRHIAEILTSYLNSYVLPVVYERNKTRVLRAVPSPPWFDIGKILRNTYVIESESLSIQGTAFHLKDYGIVTCQHCTANYLKRAEDIKIFHASEYKKKWDASCLKSNETIDLAILESNIPLQEGLDFGNSDDLVRMDHLAICGYPNYRFGDSGIFSPALVIGFRPQSGINRILINTPLIAGTSGGPIVGRTGNVVGVAVTGADKMENANTTENHGVIPIEALKYL
jgi:S1-C subfamily serine protease